MVPAKPPAPFPDWPLIEIDAGDLDPAAGHDAAFAALASALGVGEPFAAVIVPSYGPDEGRSGGTRRLAHLRWLKANRGALAERCAGIAFVLSGEQRRGSAKRLAAGAKVMGCPVSAWATLEDARRWARERLAAAGG